MVAMKTTRWDRRRAERAKIRFQLEQEGKLKEQNKARREFSAEEIVVACKEIDKKNGNFFGLAKMSGVDFEQQIDFTPVIMAEYKKTAQQKDRICKLALEQGLVGSSGKLADRLENLKEMLKAMPINPYCTGSSPAGGSSNCTATAETARGATVEYRENVNANSSEGAVGGQPEVPKQNRTFFGSKKWMFFKDHAWSLFGYASANQTGNVMSSLLLAGASPLLLKATKADIDPEVELEVRYFMRKELHPGFAVTKTP